MGSGRNGSFDKTPDLQQWSIFTVRNREVEIDSLNTKTPFNIKELYGGFIAGWLKLFGCEIWTVMLEPIEGHGRWDGKEIFGILPHQSNDEGPIAILTRATVRLNKLKYFWQNVVPVSNAMKEATGFIWSVGIGEIPWIKQATFSIWESKEAMKAFAYGTKVHADVIKKTRAQQWYSEEMFVRFKIISSAGSLKGIDPLTGKP